MINLLRWWPALAVLTGLYLFNSGWLAIFLYHIGIVLALSRQKDRWKTVFEGFRFWPAVGLFALGIGAAPVVVGAMPWLLQMAVPEIKGILLEGLGKAGISVPVGFWVFVIYLSVVHPPLEELGWRELLQVQCRHPHWRDLEFASYHFLVLHYFFAGAWLFFVVALILLAMMGWIWRRMKTSSGGLALPVIFHASGDLGVMLGLAWLMK